ncbi:P68 family surface lipoprotein [Mesomycoplasma neurolyticum]|uniref:Mycoplasma lipoprotein C-terminal domain-containing protein n=1 Tax=Mesomycoplasma neurolyticum TaxID=2120 RepID=A0A449A5K4_9BACT|nr:hypothetical protein [Mesomycoplasma neurolyticum]VEU59509.1 Uncharacterised protein [Mesomycoplasma neurolyticum]
MKFFKKRNALLILSALTTLSLTTVAASCGSNKDGDSTKIDYSNSKVKFATAQGNIWPLMRTLKPVIIEYNKQLAEYNKQQKDQNKDFQNFLEVELMTNEQTKADHSESQLAIQLATQLKDKNIENTYNLVLGNQAAAFQAHSYESLLELDDTSIKSDLFNERILKAHNTLAGQGIDSNKIYSIPFDVTDVDATVINLDIMSEILKLIKDNGGTVDENSEIYKKSDAASKAGSSIPEKSLFKKMKAKSTTAYNNLSINDKTFESILSIMDFSKKFYDGLSIDFNDTEGDATIFTIDYQEDTFFKVLKNETKKDLVETVEYKKENPQLVKFNIQDNSYQSKFKEIYEKFAGENEIKQKQKDGEAQKDKEGKVIPKQTFFNIRYAANGATDWASWDIRNYKTAIAFAPLVGINQTIKSPLSKKVFAENDDKIFNTFASNEDVLFKPQAMINSDSLKSATYLKGGSNIIPIKTGNEIFDKSTKRFLDFLYKGEMDDPELGGRIKVADYILETSSYVVPTKDYISNTKKQEYTQKMNEYEEKIKSNDPKAAQYELRKNNIKSALNTIESALSYQDNNSVELLNTYSLDGTSSEVVKLISKSLLDATKKADESHVYKDKEKLVEEILAKINNQK